MRMDSQVDRVAEEISRICRATSFLVKYLVSYVSSHFESRHHNCSLIPLCKYFSRVCLLMSLVLESGNKNSTWSGLRAVSPGLMTQPLQK